jgi:lysophospholipase
MTHPSNTPSDIEPRFQQPPGWRWHEFERDGRKIRFGGVMPPDGKAEAVVVGLQGVNEFCEKYFEVAHDLLGRNLGFWMMDWHGQGDSGRYLPDPGKRHSDGFDNDLDDLHRFIRDYVLPAAVKTDVGRLPLVMVAHSMGANLGLRYLGRHPEIFACAALTSPLTNIFALAAMPKWLQPVVGRMVDMALGTAYATGNGPWKPGSQMPEILALTSDPIRTRVAELWQQANAHLRIGGVTFGWVYHAIRSCLVVRRPDFMHNVKIPVFAILAGNEHLVDNNVARKIFKDAPDLKLVELPDARHEILMERDELRDVFLKGFDDLLKTNDIKSKLKPF